MRLETQPRGSMSIAEVVASLMLILLGIVSIVLRRCFRRNGMCKAIGQRMLCCQLAMLDGEN